VPSTSAQSAISSSTSSTQPVQGEISSIQEMYEELQMLRNAVNEERNPQVRNIDRRIQRLHFGGRGWRGRGWRGRRGARGQGRNVHIHKGNVYIYYK